MRMTLSIPVLVGSLALAGVAGCKKEESAPVAAPPAAPTTAPNTAAPAAPSATAKAACELLSAEQLKAEAGIESAGQRSSSGGADVCTWMGTDGRSVVLQVFPRASSYEDAKTAFEGLYGGKASDVSGLGDRAFSLSGKTGPLPTATFVAQKGSTPLSVQVMAMSAAPEELSKQATELTKSALANLQ